jgi:hypothetical protein
LYIKISGHSNDCAANVLIKTTSTGKKGASKLNGFIGDRPELTIVAIKVLPHAESSHFFKATKCG